MQANEAAGAGPLGYFRWAFIVTALGLALSLALGFLYEGSLGGALRIFFVCAVLAVLEISLSFDNAIVNANKLKTMCPEWRRRFLTWGILIAVFGMRIVFPLLIVVVAADVGPIEAMRLAALRPEEYAHVMEAAHLPISAFGGTFLMMVALTFFFDTEKQTHWFPWLEEPVARSASVRGVEVALVLTLALLLSRQLGAAGSDFLHAAALGLVTFLLVEVVAGFIDRRNARAAAAQGGLGAFLYLEVLDASFSFDGVIGAFALSNNMFVIAIGLGIGAMYVRSMTIMLVEQGTLGRYRYLEHGAFYAILVLAVIMYAQALIEVPEVVTGLLGAGFILLSYAASVRDNRRDNRAAAAAAAAAE